MVDDEITDEGALYLSNMLKENFTLLQLNVNSEYVCLLRRSCEFVSFCVLVHTSMGLLIFISNVCLSSITR